MRSSVDCARNHETNPSTGIKLLFGYASLDPEFNVQRIAPQLNSSAGAASSALPGVLEFHVNFSTHRARVKWDDSQIHLSAILRAISEIGYIAHPFDPGRQEKLQKQERRTFLRRIAVAALGAVQVMMLAVALYAGEYDGMETGLRDFLRWISLLLTTPVVLYSAQPFFKGAWRDLKCRQLGVGRTERQGIEDLAADRAVAVDRTAGDFFRAFADQRKGQLIGQQLVESEALPMVPDDRNVAGGLWARTRIK